MEIPFFSDKSHRDDFLSDQTEKRPATSATGLIAKHLRSGFRIKRGKTVADRIHMEVQHFHRGGAGGGWNRGKRVEGPLSMIQNGPIRLRQQSIESPKTRGETVEVCPASTAAGARGRPLLPEPRRVPLPVGLSSGLRPDTLNAH